MEPAAPSAISRRCFLTSLAATGLGVSATDLLAQAPCDDRPLGELLRTLPLYGPGAAAPPLGELVGGNGLDARLFTDLSALDHGRLVTPTAEAFVRTAAPPELARVARPWTVALGGAGDAPVRRLVEPDIARRAGDRGLHLIECAGNSNPANFGLMSAVQWDGVPLGELLDGMPRPATATGLLVSGLDQTVPGRRSAPGASWILPLAALEGTAPFLATGMNGSPLTADHGAPVRLVVPGWYGCAWIKWVNELRWVRADEPATAQMLEFASRTHQDGRPRLAADYQPPVIDTAAMPIRVEQRRVNDAIEYRVVGVVWGGARPVDGLVLRTGSRDRGSVVHVCPPPSTTTTWALWTHRWRPTEPGYYDLSLRVADPAVRTRRLDLSFYIRRVRIDEV